MDLTFAELRAANIKRLPVALHPAMAVLSIKKLD